MKVSLTFDEPLTVEAETALKAIAGYLLSMITSDISTEADQPKKPRRQRRTKAEMAEAKAMDAEAADEGDAVDEDAKPRRHRRRPATEENVTEEEPRRRRRRSPPEDSPKPGRRRRMSSVGKNDKPDPDYDPSDKDEITDRDVSKAASEGAAELTPAAVRGILDQFAVANVGELDQGQRREFIDMVEQTIEDADLDGDD